MSEWLNHDNNQSFGFKTLQDRTIYPLITYENGGPGERFKNTYELLNPRTLKILTLYQNCIFQCMGILCGISKVAFEIPHKISYLYIEGYHFDTTLQF